jgi:hypothetical protein
VTISEKDHLEVNRKIVRVPTTTNTFDRVGEPVAIDSRSQTSIDAKLGTKHYDEEARRGEESTNDQVGQSIRRKNGEHNHRDPLVLLRICPRSIDSSLPVARSNSRALRAPLFGLSVQQRWRECPLSLDHDTIHKRLSSKPVRCKNTTQHTVRYELCRVESHATERSLYRTHELHSQVGI